MRKIFFTLLVLSAGLIAYSQPKTAAPQFNLDFEKTANSRPINWSIFGSPDYNTYLDTNIAQNGKNAAVIEYHGDKPDFKAWAYSIPANYDGKKITLTGYLKTEDVTGGAGLWMRIDPSVAFDNMQDRPVKGTSDWKKYEITLDLNSSRAKDIVVGSLLIGKGKVWVDNLQVTIDGKTLENTPARAVLPAELDKEFDKGSGIDAIPLGQTTTNDLTHLGLIWGFLKYYHPDITQGNYNWDYELFRILPRFLVAKDSKARDAILTQWIVSLGNFELEDKKIAVTKDVVLKPDLEWIQHSSFSKNLTDELLKVEHAKRTEPSYYIDLFPGVENPDFVHENPYVEMKYPDAGFRLLALFSYWNKIQYYYPYKNLITEDWKNVLKEFVPKFINTTNETDYDLAALELIGSIHDTHANVWSQNAGLTKFRGANYAPVEITFIENKPVITGYYNDVSGPASGMLVGDEITTINDQPVAVIIKEQLKYTPASNYPTQLRDMAGNLLRSNDSTIKITYKRNGKTTALTLKTYAPASLNLYKRYNSNDTCFKLINKDIAYLYPGTVKESYLPAISKDMQSTKGLIIDMRCYPREFIVFSFGRYLMPKPTPFVKFSTGSITIPGLFRMGTPLNVGEKNDNYYKGKIVIIINETTQSQAEYTTMAFRAAPNVTVIGSTTAGADGNVTPFYLPGGIRTMLSGIGIFYPDGRGTQRVGIVPDMVVTPTIKGIIDGKDELLEKAIDIINKK